MHRIFVHLVAALLLALVVSCCSGCVGLASGTLPPKLTKAEKERLKNARLPLTIGVVRTNAVGQQVIARLRKTKLFDIVDYVDRLPRPPMVLAEWANTPYGAAAIPVNSLLTFGIIPTTVREPLSFGCTFYSPRHPERRVKVEYLYDSRTTLGWVVPLLALSPNIVMIPWRPDEHRRFYQHLSLAILDHSEEIKGLEE